MEFDSISQDRITMLPDELLIHILSYLPLKQAVGTAALSKRWRNLWTKIPKLTFDAYNMFGRELSYVEQRLKTLQFVRLVNGVINQLNSPLLDISAVSGYYELSGEVVSHINHWVLFALEHNVHNLNVHFRKGSTIGSWFFPPQLANNQTSHYCLSQLRLGGCEVVPSVSGFKNLKLVSLTSIVVTDQAFEDLVSNSLLLEDLFVCSAEKLTSIRIPKSLVCLKFLHIYLCHDLLNLEVNSENLTSFTYIGPKLSFSFNNISKLLVLRLGWIDNAFSQLMSKNSMLNTLILDLDLFFEKFDMDYEILPALTNLKVLILSVVSLSNGFLGFINLLRAAPSLYKFGLHLKAPNFFIHDLDEDLGEKFCHRHLREIELSGFMGQKGHIELALLLIESAVALEKMTIVPSGKRLYLSKWHCEMVEPEQLDAIRKCADQISSKLPHQLMDNMLNASMENMAEAAVDNMVEPVVDNVTTEQMKEYKEMGVWSDCSWVEGANVPYDEGDKIELQVWWQKAKPMVYRYRIYNSLLVESGGHENITYNQRDVRNVVHLNRRKSRLEGDAVALEKYFQQQYEYNQEFYSAIERDDDDPDEFDEAWGLMVEKFWHSMTTPG
ncbi:hypothetical protein RDABS01_017681 [Bienertia sinuspersici]